MVLISTINHFATNTMTLRVPSCIPNGTPYIINQIEDKQHNQLNQMLLPCKYSRCTIIVCVYKINYVFVVEDCSCGSSLPVCAYLPEMKVIKVGVGYERCTTCSRLMKPHCSMLSTILNSIC